jgi:hypothetical protein
LYCPEKIGDDGFQIGGLGIGLRPDPAEIVHHQVDILIVAAGHDRGRPMDLRITNSTQQKR